MAQFLDKAGAKLICDSIKSVKDSYLPLTGGTVTGTINVDEVSSIGKNPMIIRGNSAEDQILFYAGSKENPVTDINFQIINGNDGLGFSINQKNYPISDTESVNTGLFLTTKNTLAVYSAIPFFNSKQFGVIKKTPSINQFFIDQYKSPSVKPFIVEGGALFSGEIENLAPTGTIPFKVSSTTLCPNLNADMLDGKHADDFATKDYVDSKVSGGTGGIGSKVIEISEKDGGYIQFYGHFDDREEDVSDTFRIRPKYNALYIENTSSDGHDIYLKTEDGSLQIGDSGSATFRNTYVVIEDFGLQLKTKGSQPIRTESTSLCPNLNADLLDGYHAEAFATKEYVDSKVPGKFIKTAGTITLKLLRTLTSSMSRCYIYLEGVGQAVATLNSFIAMSLANGYFSGVVTNYGKRPINECYWYTKDSDLYIQIVLSVTCNIQARAYETALITGNELKNLDFEIIENPDLSDVQLKSFNQINNVIFDGDTSLHKDFNADMVDGKHASDFADATDTKTKIDNLQSQINNISTSGGGSTIDASGLIKSGTANNAVVVGNLSSNTASGAHSFATGNTSKAIGAASFVSGFSNEATGMRAFAANSANKALGVQTAVFGEYNTASALAKNTFIAGEHNDVDGDVCFVAGYYNTVSGTKNAVFGKNNTLEGSSESVAHNLVSGNGNTIKVESGRDAKNNIIGGTNNVMEPGGSNNLILGINNTLNGVGAHNIIGGRYNTISGSSSLVIGNQQDVDGSCNVVGGHSNNVNAHQSIAVGGNNTLSGENSMAFGQSNNVDGTRCFGAGYSNRVSGSSAFALGQNLVSEGNMTIVVGAGNEAYNEAEFACGEQNKTIQAGTWGAGGTLFTVGNGVKATKHNALEIRQNGDIFIADTNAPGRFYEKPMRKLQTLDKRRRFVFVDGYMPLFAKPYHVYFTNTIKLNALVGIFGTHSEKLHTFYISKASARMKSLLELFKTRNIDFLTNHPKRFEWLGNIYQGDAGFNESTISTMWRSFRNPHHLYAKLHYGGDGRNQGRHFGIYFDEYNVAHEYQGSAPIFEIPKYKAVALLREFAKMVNADNNWGTDIVRFNHDGEYLEFEYYRKYQRKPLETAPGVYKKFPRKLWHKIRSYAGGSRQWTDSHGRKKSTMIVNYLGLWDRHYWRARATTHKHKSDWVYFVVTHPLEREIKIKILDN